MLTVSTEEDLRRYRRAARATGHRVALVPTMGALHEGHLSLVDEARRHADRVVVSIFVNPAQFGPGEDLGRYPRTPDHDAALLAERGCDLLFLPEVETIYPPGAVTFVEVTGPPARGLEGSFRPGHFRGVATVVTVLFALVEPEVAVFGEKDAQQLAVVRRLVRDLRLPVTIVAAPTVREEDGLARSSRNAYLSPPERRAATVLFRALTAAREALEGGERSAAQIRARLRGVLAEEPAARVDYAEVVAADTFEPVEVIAAPVIVPLAVHIGGTRLIDNLHFDPERES
jgi:pantoate--beta-alanine ligase